jgi:hypothetical protein
VERAIKKQGNLEELDAHESFVSAYAINNANANKI